MIRTKIGDLLSKRLRSVSAYCDQLLPSPSFTYSHPSLAQDRLSLPQVGEGWEPALSAVEGSLRRQDEGQRAICQKIARRSGFAAVIAVLFLTLPATAGEWSGYYAIESRAFPQQAQWPDQARTSPSVVFAPEYSTDWSQGRVALVFEGFLRADGTDKQRTHGDIQSLYLETIGNWWEIRAGIQTVFWGVTESQHLVDILNQTNLVERPDGEAKLGQPMVNLSIIQNWGVLDLYVLTGFRTRTFPGADGRLRAPLIVDTDQVVYTEDKWRRHLGGAVRWSHTLDMFDFGLSHFYGTGRDPGLVQSGNVLIPHYYSIHQTGLDVQATNGGWLWKFETIRRSGNGSDYTAATGGFEYTLSNIRNTGADVGLVVEYLYDDRGNAADTPFDNDLFFGTRIALNDVQSAEMLAGAIVDFENGTTVASVEASRRFGESWKVDLEMRSFFKTDQRDLLAAFKQDHYVEFKLARYF